MRAQDVGRRARQEGRGRVLTALLGIMRAPYSPRATRTVRLGTKCYSRRTLDRLCSLIAAREKERGQGKEGNAHPTVPLPYPPGGRRRRGLGRRGKGASAARASCPEANRRARL